MNAPLTRERIANYVERRLARIQDPAGRTHLRAVLAQVPFPKTIPAFSDLMVDAVGNLWVGDYHDFGEAQRHWTVFDPNGQLLGDIDVPDRFTIYDIGDNYILGRSRDEFDVERVVLHRLHKPAPVN